MDEKVLEKLKILAESAKYDVSCASSGTSRSHKSGAIGSAAGWGICHSFAEDGRCIIVCMIAPTASTGEVMIYRELRFPLPSW